MWKKKSVLTVPDILVTPWTNWLLWAKHAILQAISGITHRHSKHGQNISTESLQAATIHPLLLFLRSTSSEKSGQQQQQCQNILAATTSKRLYKQYTIVYNWRGQQTRQTTVPGTQWTFWCSRYQGNAVCPAMNWLTKEPRLLPSSKLLMQLLL